MVLLLPRFALAEEISNPPNNKPGVSVSNEPSYSPTGSDSSPLVPSLEDKPNVLPTSEKPNFEVSAPPGDQITPSDDFELEIEGSKPFFEIDNIPSYNPTDSSTFPTLPSFSDKPNVTPTEAHPNTPQSPNYSDPTTEESVNLPDPVNTPTISPQGTPDYNPGSIDAFSPTIPDAGSKPNLVPFQSSPNVPDLQIVPYGYPGTVIYYDSTSVDVGDSLNTSKLDLLESGSVVSAEDILNLSSEEADALASLGPDNGDDVSNAIELKKKLVSSDGQNEDRGIKVIKLISEKNLDSNKLLTLDSSTLDLIADFSDKTTTEAESALMVAEIGGESGLRLATEKNLDIQKLSQRNTAEINLISSIGSDAQKAESALKVAEIGGESGLKLATEKNLDIQKLSQRNTAEINLISSIGSDAQKAESALKVAELGGEGGLKLATEKNLDIQKLSQRNTAELNLISTIGSDSSKALQALSIAEKFDSSNRQSSEVLLQGISKVSQSDSSKVDLFLDAVSDTDSAILVNKAESFSKVSNNTQLVSSLNTVTTKTGQVINPVSRLIKMNKKLLDEFGATENLENENLKSVVNIISDGFIPKGAEKPSEIQLSDIESLGTDDGTNLGTQIAADLTNSESAEELAKEMQEMIPPVLAVNGNLYAAEIADKLLLLSQIPKSQRRLVDPLDTDDYKIAVRDVFIDDYLELGTSKVNSLGLKSLFDLSNNSAKNLYLSAMSGSSLQDFSNNVDSVIPDELDAVLHIGKVASVPQRSNLRRRQSTMRLAKMGYPLGDNLISAFASKAVNQALSEGKLLAEIGNNNLRQSQLDDSSKQDNRNGVFTQFYVSDTEDNYLGLNGDGMGFMVGVDQHISESLTFGICGGVSKTTGDDSSFSIESDSLFAGVYLNYLKDNYYADVTFDFGYHSIDNERLGLDDLTYFSSAGVNEKTLNLTIGRVIDSNHFVLNPYLSFQYGVTNSGDFYETGGIGAHKIYAQEANSMIGEIGLECAYFDYLPNGNL
ncbi:MAG: autotransporter domain-containing protein, partial [Balneolaceae bacterium]|nr:autotransporter domain-containing protein [Balneolaceae bacterium]